MSDNAELPTVLELSVGEKADAKEVISVLEDCGYDARIVGQTHDTLRDVEVLEYDIEPADSDGNGGER